MNYFITGGTGFIGHNLIDELLKQKKKAVIYVLVRKDSKKKFDVLKKQWGAAAKRVIPLTGDLTKPFLGITPGKRKELSLAITSLPNPIRSEKGCMRCDFFHGMEDENLSACSKNEIQ